MKLRLWLSILVVTVCASLGMQACTHKEDEIVGKVLSLALADNVKASQLKPDGAYGKNSPPAEDRRLRSQFLFEALAKKAYRDTILDNRQPKL